MPPCRAPSRTAESRQEQTRDRDRRQAGPAPPYGPARVPYFKLRASQLSTSGADVSMILPFHDRLRTHLTALLARLYTIAETALPSIVLEYPPNRELGDIGTPLAF